MDDLILYAARDGVARLTLNRPDRANSLTEPLIAQLQARALEAANDVAVRVLVVTGAGRHFCAGADLKANPNPTPSTEIRRPGFDPRTALDWVPKPVIAALNGSAMGGGCEIALACDFRFMAEGARIGLPEIRFGALPSGGGTVRATRLLGPAAAKRLIFTGEALDAATALRIGLVDEVHPSAALMAAALDFAGVLAQRPAYALRTAKQLIDKATDLDLRTALELERSLVRAMATPEERRAAQAAAAGSDPVYGRVFAAPATEA